MRRWDMHVHTSWSDGSTASEDAVRFAAGAGLAGISITDHDSMGAVAAAQRAAAGYGLEIIPGVELSSIDSGTGRKVHILVYYPLETGELNRHFENMAEQRRASGKEMTGLLKSRFPITREMVERHSRESGTIYRTHIMRALMDMGCANRIYGELYSEIFGAGSGFRRNVRYSGVDEVALMARNSGGVVILAHPGVYDSFETAERLAEKGLIDGIENSYPRKRGEDEGRHAALIEKYGLITSGGTDYHGWYAPYPHPLGFCTAGEDEVLKIKSLSEKRRGKKP